MQIHTSRYQNGEVIAGSGLVPIGVTRGYPQFNLKGYKPVRNLQVLAPTKEMGTIKDDDEFEAAYRRKLDAIGVDAIRDLLTEVGGGGDVVILCYEHIGHQGEKSCHRRTFARWWEEKTGEAVTEIEDTGTYHPPKGSKAPAKPANVTDARLF
jgi:hypothetical protein